MQGGVTRFDNDVNPYQTCAGGLGNGPSRSVPQNVIKHKVGLLNLAAELGGVSRICKVAGFSRDTFYYYQSAMAGGGVDALINAKRKQLNLRNQVAAAIGTLGNR